MMCLTPKYLTLLPQPRSLVPFLKGRIFLLTGIGVPVLDTMFGSETQAFLCSIGLCLLIHIYLTTSRPTHCTLLKLGRAQGPFNWWWETLLVSLPSKLYMAKHHILYLVVTGFNSEGRIPWTTRRRRLSSWMVCVARPWWTHTATYQAVFCEWSTDTNQEHTLIPERPQF